MTLMSTVRAAHPEKFQDPDITAKGERRAWVTLERLDALWFNTGTLCNLSCGRCYIESSPCNDRLVYLSAAEVAEYLDEIAALGLPTRTIGFTGGEPFLNRALPEMLRDVLARGLDALVLTNAMTPLRHAEAALLALNAAHPGRLALRVSLDHYAADLHDGDRGAGSFKAALLGLTWLARHGFAIQVAGRRFCSKPETAIRAGYAALFGRLGVALNAFDPGQLVLFPEMDGSDAVPEITTRCWDILGKSPSTVMCATSRMVVRRKGAARPAVVACTLLPYDARFELGDSLAEAERSVPLNHPHCAKFCVLGGGSCKT